MFSVTIKTTLVDVVMLFAAHAECHDAIPLPPPPSRSRVLLVAVLLAPVVLGPML
jgi:hypothetical protein